MLGENEVRRSLVVWGQGSRNVARMARSFGLGPHGWLRGGGLLRARYLTAGPAIG